LPLRSQRCECGTGSSRPPPTGTTLDNPSRSCGTTTGSPPPSPRPERSRPADDTTSSPSIRRQRRRRTITTLTAVLTAITSVAVQQRSLAIHQRQAAIAEQRLATLRGLTVQALAERDRDVRAALRLGLAAREMSPSPETDRSLADTLTSTRLTASLSGHVRAVNAVAFSRDGRTLATASTDGTVALWDITDRRRPARTATLNAHTGAVWTVAFSPDGRALATTGIGGTVVLWDITDWQRPAHTATLAGRANAVSWVVFSRDGHALTTASEDGTVALWDVAWVTGLPGHLAEWACAATGGGLPRKE